MGIGRALSLATRLIDVGELDTLLISSRLFWQGFSAYTTLADTLDLLTYW